MSELAYLMLSTDVLILAISGIFVTRTFHYMRLRINCLEAAVRELNPGLDL